VPTGRYAPEWELAEKEDQHILSVLRGMAKVVERNPHSFRSLDEVAIRDHFLLQLNGHYEGGATGNTLNRAAKTHILARAGAWGEEPRGAQKMLILFSHFFPCIPKGASVTSAPTLAPSCVNDCRRGERSYSRR
jgi:hypothetical protein